MGGVVQKDVAEGGQSAPAGGWRGQRVSLAEKTEEEEEGGVDEGDEQASGDGVGGRAVKEATEQSGKGKGNSSKQDGSACDVHTKVRRAVSRQQC